MALCVPEQADPRIDCIPVLAYHSGLSAKVLLSESIIPEPAEDESAAAGELPAPVLIRSACCGGCQGAAEGGQGHAVHERSASLPHDPCLLPGADQGRENFV